MITKIALVNLSSFIVVFIYVFEFLGYMVYLNPAPPRTSGDRAILYSGIYEPTLTGDCVKFWYYMNGIAPGSLSVWRSMGGNLDGPLWTKSGDQGALWRYGYTTITANDDFRVSSMNMNPCGKVQLTIHCHNENTILWLLSHARFSHYC